MKVFDFSNGVKGKLLDEVGLMTFTGCCVYTNNLVTGKVEYLHVKDERQLGPQTSLTVHTTAGRLQTKYTPEMFGVEAILMCWGQEHFGYGFKEAGDWKWVVVGTDEWVARALSNGFFKE